MTELHGRDITSIISPCQRSPDWHLRHLVNTVVSAEVDVTLSSTAPPPHTNIVIVILVDQKTIFIGTMIMVSVTDCVYVYVYSLSKLGKSKVYVYVFSCIVLRDTSICSGYFGGTTERRERRKTLPY